MTSVFGCGWLLTCSHKTSYNFFSSGFSSAVLISSTNLLCCGHLSSVGLNIMFIVFLLQNTSVVQSQGTGAFQFRDVLLYSLWKQQTSLTAFFSPLPQLMYGVWAFTKQLTLRSANPPSSKKWELEKQYLKRRSLKFSLQFKKKLKIPETYPLCSARTCFHAPGDRNKFWELLVTWVKHRAWCSPRAWSY